MIEYINGLIMYINEDYVVIDNNGKGYKIFMSNKNLEIIKEMINQEYKVFTHLHFRENILDFYGFMSFSELKFFKILISLSGIGAKSALKVMETVTGEEFALLIKNNDILRLQKIPGIGKKTAQKLLLEVKDLIEKEYKNVFSNNQEQSVKRENIDTDIIKESKSGLIALGYTSSEAKKAIESIYKEGMTVENIIKESLKYLITK